MPPRSCKVVSLALFGIGLNWFEAIKNLLLLQLTLHRKETGDNMAVEAKFDYYWLQKPDSTNQVVSKMANLTNSTQLNDDDDEQDEQFLIILF